MKLRTNYVSNSSSTSFVFKTAVVKKTFDEIMDRELNRHMEICSNCNKFLKREMACAETPFDFENFDKPFEQRCVPRSCEFYAEQFISQLQ